MPDGRWVGPPPLARGPPTPGQMDAAGSRSTPARAGTTTPTRSSSTTFRVHPRSRGDHAIVGSSDYGVRGPPPLARGPHDLVLIDVLVERSTPARAGTTPSRRRPTRRSRVHPRSRGDHERHPDVPPDRVGPPPLARGPRLTPAVGEGGPRSTPARAGTTLPAQEAAVLRGVHPRSRGDHRMGLAYEIRREGPPPLARGPRANGSNIRNVSRSTPARAGTTEAIMTRTTIHMVHPRSRGDHERHPDVPPDRVGPPPLARGPLGRMPSLCVSNRSTPARAGTTVARWSGSLIDPVHPRSRGDHRAAQHPALFEVGPPPLARGPPRRPAQPADADAVHPRSRGDHSGVKALSASASGPPPLARGPRHSHAPAAAVVRSTPARAGTTLPLTG